MTHQPQPTEIARPAYHATGSTKQIPMLAVVAAVLFLLALVFARASCA